MMGWSIRSASGRSSRGKTMHSHMGRTEAGRIEKEGTEGILEDTRKKTGLLLQVCGTLYPLGETAVKPLEDRARISGRALALLEKEKLARILNECLEAAAGPSLVRVGEGKVRAAHSMQYKILRMPDVFRTASGRIHDSYDGVFFSGGGLDHSRTTALWEIRDERLVGTYRDLIAGYEGSCPQLAAQIRVTTSDTADSGANIFYNLLAGPARRKIALGTAVKLEHEGDASLEKFGQNMDRAFSRYRETTKQLGMLMHVHIRYPLSVMGTMLKKIRIPAELREETMNLFMNSNGTEECSAYEVYCGICECLYLAQEKGIDGYAMASLEEEVSRCLDMRYSGMDFPGMEEEKAGRRTGWAA